MKRFPFQSRKHENQLLDLLNYYFFCVNKMVTASISCLHRSQPDRRVAIKVGKELLYQELGVADTST
jgi:hypothetical protein